MNARSHVAEDLQRHIYRDVWDVWLKAKTTKECQVSIEDLIPGSRCTRTLSFVLFQHSCSLLTRYKFRIKAENAYGISDESQESDPFDVNQPIAGESQEPPGVITSIFIIIIMSIFMLGKRRAKFDPDD